MTSKNKEAGRAEPPPSEPPQENTMTKTYKCGCSASGSPDLPDYCPTHGSAWACSYHQPTPRENCVQCFQAHPVISELRRMREENEAQPASVHCTNVTVALGHAIEKIAELESADHPPPVSPSGYSTIEAVRAEVQDKLSVYAHAAKRGNTANGQIVRQQVEDFLVALVWGEHATPAASRTETRRDEQSDAR